MKSIIQKLLACMVFISCSFCYAQQSSNAKLDALVATCDSLVKNANYTSVEKITGDAIKDLSPADKYYRAMFNYYAAVACEASTAPGSTCIALYKITLENAKQLGNIALSTKAMGKMLTLYEPSKFSERDSFARILKIVADTTGSEEIKSIAWSSLVGYNTWIGENGKGLQYALDALTIQKKIYHANGKNKNELAEALMNVAKTYSNMSQDDKQMAYLDEMRSYIDDNPSLLANFHLYKGRILFVAKKIEDAKLHYDTLTVLCNRYNNAEFWNSRIDIDMYFAQGFLKFGDLDNALKYASSGSTIGKQWAYDFQQTRINYTNGAVHYARKEYPQAIDFLKTAEKLSYANNYTDIYMSCLRKIGGSYAGLNQWQTAYQYADKLYVVKDSLTTISSDHIFAEAEEKYQNNEKKQQIVNQKTQLLFAKKQRTWLIAGIGLAALVAILLLFIYRNKKRSAEVLNKKNKELEDANRTKAKLFSIISHDLRSPISQVYQFLKLQQMDPHFLDEKQQQELSIKIQSATGSLLETMEDLLIWSKTQLDEFKANKQPVLLLPVIQNCQNLLQLNTETKHISYQNTVTESLSADTDPYYLQTIIRNLLQNAIKAAPENSIISIAAERRAYGLVMTISNEGETLTQERYLEVIHSEETAKSMNGFGLRLVDELAKKIGAEINFITDQRPGTSVQIILS